MEVKSVHLLNTFTAAIQKDRHLNSLTVYIEKLVYFSYYILNCIKHTNSKSKYFVQATLSEKNYTYYLPYKKYKQYLAYF